VKKIKYILLKISKNFKIRDLLNLYIVMTDDLGLGEDISFLKSEDINDVVKRAFLKKL
jgi:hypothetical protein